MFAIPTAFADICEDQIPIGENCTMLTPVLECDIYNYTIIDEEGSVVEQDNLILLNGSIYYFIFNQNTGGYIVELCDGSTREITIGIKNKMAWLSIMLVMGLMSMLFLWTSFNIKEKRLDSLKAFLFLYGVVNTLLLGFFPYVISSNPDNASAFLPLAVGYMSVSGIILLFFVWYYASYLLGRSLDHGK